MSEAKRRGQSAQSCLGSENSREGKHVLRTVLELLLAQGKVVRIRRPGHPCVLTRFLLSYVGGDCGQMGLWPPE